MIIAVTGLPGSGKSFFSSQFKHFSVPYWDADVLGHEILKNSRVIQLLTAEFGERILDANGFVCRKSLGAQVFGKVDRYRALNDICHPAIHELLLGYLNQVPKDSYGVFEAALLWEAGFDDLCDISVVVDTPFDLRCARVAHRGWDKQELINRDKAQDASLKLSRSDLCLDGELSENQLWSFALGVDVAMRFALAVGDSQRAMDLLRNKTEIKII
jgi:dephospho-CoA kinase